MNQSSPYEDLIARVLAGEATAFEQRELEAWRKENDANEEEFQALKKSWELSSGLKGRKFDVDAAWRKVKREAGIEQTVTEAKTIPLWRRLPRLGIAAMLAVMVSISSILLWQKEGSQEMIVMSLAEAVEVYLPDSSLATLQPGGELRYNKDFSPREVQLSGTATFDVRTMSGHGFKVSADFGEVQVLGTVFTVTAAPDSFKVEVQSGKVKVLATKSKKEAVLTEGMEALLLKGSDTISVGRAEPQAEVDILGKTLVFEDTDLNQVVRTLGSVFGKTIRLADESLAGCRLTASFHDQSLQEVLTIVAATFDLKISEEAEVFILSGDGC